MIRLYVDILTNRITGYNRIAQEGFCRDAIRIADKELEKLNAFMEKEFYYIDGEIIEGSVAPKDGCSEESGELEYMELREKVDCEHKIFMDNLISGMKAEEAAGIAKKNRDALEAAEKQREQRNGQQKEKTKQAVIEKFEKEERGIDYKYFLSMVTIVRDENDYLEEWIRYHIEELGFEHFYIYDNESAVPVRKYLEKADFPHLDKVTVINWPTSENSQQDSHNDFLEKYSLETKWFLAADPDEYVVAGSRTLKEILQENGQYSTIQCLWKCFNANGHRTKSDEPDMLRFTEEAEWDYGVNKGKYFAQSNRVESFRNYIPKARPGTDCLDYRDEKIKDFFRLNHYYTRSFEEWIQKMARGTAVPYARRNFREFFELNPDMACLDTGEDYRQEYGPGKGTI